MSLMTMNFSCFDSANQQGIVGGREADDPCKTLREEERTGLSHMQVWRSLILVDEIQKSEFTPVSVAVCWIYFMCHRPGLA